VNAADSSTGPTAGTCLIEAVFAFREPATPAAAACLLHADFHPMAPECWAATTGWYFAHGHLPDAEQRSAYQAEVERRMLNGLCGAGEPAGGAG
jgi:hypothetical protein